MPTKMKDMLTRLGVPEENRFFKDAKDATQGSRLLGEVEGVLFPKL